ncbi:MAG TPA: DUF3536 domain-containing protein [Ignavibacteriaceae bacterium]|nr:DUF3536 domain-containing protein [Ignavibacteriaceae bacterium]
MSEKYVCIHGHFYQPPRENPWLEEVEVQDSAFPYRDWNERITAECYNPNTAARILKDNNIVIDIVNNYTRMSFNFGPTLLSWLEEHSPEVYESILKADDLSRDMYSGHGTAIAQVYNHIIMPLANIGDRRTQIIWGIQDFKKRFGREPEGMWLAETAVDNQTLELLAEYGINFTILAPHQAGEVKLIEDNKWTDVNGGKVDPKRAYICHLPSGKSINLFFYDGPISQELGFGNLLENGENLGNRLMSTFREDDEPQLVHIATDGETYGHHKKHGEMALAYCIHYLKENGIKITNYGEFLEKFPPKWEVKIVENTSWSCVHGIERWRSNCGCNTGRAGWTQEWRGPLRDALDWLRDNLAKLYEENMKEFADDPWGLRDKYISIILDRSPVNLKNFFKENLKKELDSKERIKFLKLMEIQRHALLMYTSCGWFFDEISGIETVQVILYAGRAIQLTKEITDIDYENEFMTRLEGTKSNIPEIGNGSEVYRRFVKPSMIDLLKVAAHYAVSSLFENYSEENVIFSYEVFNEKLEFFEAGKSRMVIGKAKMRSQVTYEEQKVSFAFIHLGEHNLNGGVKDYHGDEAYDRMHNELADAFERLDISEMMILIDKHFENHNYNLQSLFKDEKRKVFNKILEETVNDVESSYRHIFEEHYPIMLSMTENGIPIPSAIYKAAEYVINKDLEKVFELEESIVLDKLQNLKKEVKRWNIQLDNESLNLTGSERINKLMNELKRDPENIDLIKEIDILVSAFNDLGVKIDLWKAQNALFEISKDQFKPLTNKAKRKNQSAKELLDNYHILEDKMQMKIQ